MICLYQILVLLLVRRVGARDDAAWMINVTRYGMDAGESGFSQFTPDELTELASRAYSWDSLSSEHIFWGQAFPQIIWADANRSAPIYFDDVGDTACWTGTLLAALAHQYKAIMRSKSNRHSSERSHMSLENIADGNETLRRLQEVVDFYDTATNCTSSPGYLPRTLAKQEDNSSAYQAWFAYFGTDALPDPDHRVWACTSSPEIFRSEPSNHDNAYNTGSVWLWQGDSSRDTYIGSLFGLASVLLQFSTEGQGSDGATLSALPTRAQAALVFERIFDKLSSDGFWIVPPTLQRNQLPVRPTPLLRCAFIRVALSLNPDKYDSMWRSEYYGLWLPVAVATEKISPLHRSGYYGNNLLAMAWYVITAFELRDSDFDDNDADAFYRKLKETEAAAASENVELAHPAVQKLPRQDTRQGGPAAKIARTLSDKACRLLSSYASHLQANINAYFASVPGLLDSCAAPASVVSPDFRPFDAALPIAIASASLWDLPVAPDYEHAVAQPNCTNPDTEPAPGCYHGPDVLCSEPCNCSTTALLVRDRPPNEFLWQIDPTKLSGGSDRPEDNPETGFGGAFLAPYWIMRSAGLIGDGGG